MTNIYIDEDEGKRAISSRILANSAIAKNISIDSESEIKGSVLGVGCRVGKNVRIFNSIIGQKVNIGDNCVITNSIIQSNVTIGASTTISKGVMIGEGVEVNHNVEIAPYSICSLFTYDTDEKDFKLSDSSSQTNYFKDGKGLKTYIPTHLRL